MVSGTQSVIRFGNFVTASFCDDRWREEVPNKPKLRTISRLILTLTTICLIVIAALLLFQFRSVRYLGKELLTTIHNRRLNVSSSQNPSSHPEKLVCPCTNQNSIAWSSFMKTSMLSKNSENRFDQYWINAPSASHDFCWKEWKPIDASSYLYWGCPVMVEALMSIGTQTLTSTLLDEDSLVTTVTNSIQQTLNSVLDSYRVLLNSDKRHEWEMVEELWSAFRLMKDVFRQNSSSSEEDYWNAFRSSQAPDKANLQDVLIGRALTMELNWTVYLEQCSPVYCDEVVPNSVLSRFLSAVAQVGGLISALLFVVRSAVWPVLRLLGGWSIDHPSKSEDDWKTT